MKKNRNMRRLLDKKGNDGTRISGHVQSDMPKWTFHIPLLVYMIDDKGIKGATDE